MLDLLHIKNRIGKFKEKIPELDKTEKEIIKEIK